MQRQPRRRPARCAERLPGIAEGVIEAQLAYGKSGPLGMAYDRADFMEQRRTMMNAWADYLDRLRDTAKVIPLQHRAARRPRPAGPLGTTAAAVRQHQGGLSG